MEKWAVIVGILLFFSWLKKPNLKLRDYILSLLVFLLMFLIDSFLPWSEFQVTAILLLIAICVGIIVVYKKSWPEDF